MNSKKIDADDLFDFSGLTTGREDVSGHRQTRIEESLTTYSAHARSLYVRSSTGDLEPSADRIEHTVSWFLAQDEAWSKNTIKAYRASLHCMLERAAALKILDAGEFKTLGAQLGGERSRHPAVMPKGDPRRTSALKRKSVDLDERKRLMAHLRKIPGDTSETLRALIYFGPDLGLRFVEYLTAETRDTTLHVTCAKATNGRALAQVRTIDLSGFSASEQAALRSFLLRIKRLAREAGSAKKLHARLAKALSRACITISIEKISLYTLRHQALATAKRTMSPVAVAALAGHKTTRTASQHYASKRSGWRRALRVSPTPDMMPLVAAREPRTANAQVQGMRR